MKKTIIITAMLLLLTSVATWAAEKPNPLAKMKAMEIAHIYNEAATLGKTDLNRFLFAADFEYHNSTRRQKYSRKPYMKYLDSQRDLKLDCETTLEVLDECNSICFARSTMKFKNFTRIDHIQLEYINDTWQITEITTTYPDTKK